MNTCRGCGKDFTSHELKWQGFDGYFYCTPCSKIDRKQDNINHPQYYKGKNGIEAIEVVEGFELGFHTASAVDYILRAGKKDPNTEIDDYKKAIWFLNRKIKTMEEK